MNCLFCAAKSAPQAKFCSECGSPLYLQICPTCAAVNEKTASRCVTCGHAFALQPDRAVAAAVAQTASSLATSLASDAAVDVKDNERKVLLQEIAQEIHRQLEAEQHAAAPNRLSLARRVARLAANRALMWSIPTEYAGRSRETRRTRSRLSGVVLILTLVLIGGAAAAYLLPSSSDTPPLSNHNASRSQGAAVPQLMSPRRDLAPGDQVNRGNSTAAVSGATAASVSPGSPQLVPPDDESNNLFTTAGAKNNAAELIPMPIAVAPPAEVVLEERKQDQAGQPAARKGTSSHRTIAKGGEKAAQVPSLPVEHRLIVEAPERFPAQPAIADSRPCSDAIQALALCSGPSRK
jgi:hypothetical protein